MNPEQLTIAGMLTAVLIAGARGAWVFGWIYRREVEESKFWRDRALIGTGLAEIAEAEAERRTR